MCTPSMPGGSGNAYWGSGAPGMTPEETKKLPGLSLELLAWGGIGGVMEASQQRDAAMERWKAANPERYQQALREMEQANQPPQEPARQAARTARQGAGGGGGAGGGSSSQNTLLTPGAPEGVEPGELNLAKTTLLGL